MEKSKKSKLKRRGWMELMLITTGLLLLVAVSWGFKQEFNREKLAKQFCTSQGYEYSGGNKCEKEWIEDDVIHREVKKITYRNGRWYLIESNSLVERELKK